MDEGQHNPQRDRSESSVRQTWWFHPETGRRMVLSRGPNDAVHVQVDGHLLRAAKLFLGGPTGWCVEVGEERPPAPGERYLAPDGVIRTAEKGSGYRHLPILEPLPPSEFAAHGVEQPDWEERKATIQRKSDGVRDGIRVTRRQPDPQDTSEADVPARHLRGRESDPQDTAPARCTCDAGHVEGDWHRPNCAYGRSEQDTAPSAESDTTGEAEEEEYHWRRLTEQIEQIASYGLDKALRVREIVDTAIEAHRPEGEGEDIEWPVTWTDRGGFKGEVDSYGMIHVGVPEGLPCVGVGTTPEDRARIIRALQAIDGTNEAQRKENHGRTTGTAAGTDTPGEGEASREGASTPPSGSWSGDLDNDDAADPGVRGEAAHGDRGGVLGPAPTEDEELVEWVRNQLNAAHYAGMEAASRGGGTIESSATARRIIARVRGADEAAVLGGDPRHGPSSCEECSPQVRYAYNVAVKAERSRLEADRRAFKAEARVKGLQDEIQAVEGRVKDWMKLQNEAEDRAANAEEHIESLNNEVLELFHRIDRWIVRYNEAEDRAEKAEKAASEAGGRATAWERAYGQAFEWSRHDTERLQISERRIARLRRALGKEHGRALRAEARGDSHLAEIRRRGSAEPVRVTNGMVWLGAQAIAGALGDHTATGWWAWTEEARACIEAALAQSTSEGDQDA